MVVPVGGSGTLGSGGEDSGNLFTGSQFKAAPEFFSGLMDIELNSPLAAFHDLRDIANGQFLKFEKHDGRLLSIGQGLHGADDFYTGFVS